MTIHQEIRKILKNNGKAIVDERIGIEIIGKIADYTARLVERMTTLDRLNKRQFDRTYDRIYTDLIGQTIRYLFEAQGDRKNKYPLS